MATRNDYNKLTAALQYLAGVCDGARTWNGAGFNKFDAEFGKALAERTLRNQPLSAKQTAAAFKMVRKYRRQLEDAGLEVPEALSAAPKPAPEAQEQPEAQESQPVGPSWPQKDDPLYVFEPLEKSAPSATLFENGKIVDPAARTAAQALLSAFSNEPSKKTRTDDAIWQAWALHQKPADRQAVYITVWQYWLKTNKVEL